MSTLTATPDLEPAFLAELQAARREALSVLRYVLGTLTPTFGPPPVEKLAALREARLAACDILAVKLPAHRPPRPESPPDPAPPDHSPPAEWAHAPDDGLASTMNFDADASFADEPADEAERLESEPSFPADEAPRHIEPDPPAYAPDIPRNITFRPMTSERRAAINALLSRLGTPP